MAENSLDDNVHLQFHFGSHNEPLRRFHSTFWARQSSSSRLGTSIEPTGDWHILTYKKFPTCQVRVVRFYQSACPPPPRLVVLLAVLLAWTSTCELPSSVCTAGPQRTDRMPEDMPDGMSDRMPEDMPDKMPWDMSDRMKVCQMECQIKCQIECHKIC